MRVNLVGDRLPEVDIKAIEQRLPEFGLADVKLLLVQSGQIAPDMNTVEKDLINEMLQTNRADTAEREVRIVALQVNVTTGFQGVAAKPDAPPTTAVAGATAIARRAGCRRAVTSASGTTQARRAG